YLAHNPFKCEMPELIELLAKEGAQPVEVPAVPGCIHCAVPAAAVGGSALSEGLAIVADAGAQFAARCAIPPDGGLVVDIAAGRGTKTALILAGLKRAGRSARVVAVDIHGFKAGVARARLAELGMPEVEFVEADSTNRAALLAGAGEGSADVALVDTPCSGLGTLRRHPEKRWRLRPQDIDSVAVTARRMLAAAAALVRPGGFVVYSTCTVTRRENDQLVDSFLASSAGEGFSSEDMRSRIPEGWMRFVNSAGRVQILPEQDGPDGHYVAVLIRDLA
ncbi:MAG: RsmB/NOP family class I SAM-dependent RNA methyltransferase, partial [Coriobacteriia bacterium]|nr:RsmB/NOP family class I SAM-dependent RNA methyltransferase [Coriobacteriia bacterium]